MISGSDVSPGWTERRKAKFDGPFGPGRGISVQARALGKRSRHITGLAAHDDRSCEVHPEVCFWAMNGQERLSCPK
jgi:predicted RNase H-like nuclease